MIKKRLYFQPRFRNSFKINALAKGNAADVTGALYYQQVQISGEG